MGGVQDPAKGGPGYLHPFGSVLLVEPLLVGQTERFQFVHAQLDLFQPG